MKFSTGATYRLLEALTVLGRRDERKFDAVVTFLEGHMCLGHNHSPMGRGFDLYPLPAGLGSGGAGGLAELLAQFGWQLCQLAPDPSLCEVPWDRPLRLSWLARVLDLREMALEAAGIEAGELPLPLSPVDREHCAYLRAEWRTSIVARGVRSPESPLGDLVAVDSCVALAHLDGLIDKARRLHGIDPDFYPHRLVDLLCKRAEVLEKAGRRQAAIAANDDAIPLEDCVDSRALLHELINTLRELP